MDFKTKFLPWSNGSLQLLVTSFQILNEGQGLWVTAGTDRMIAAFDKGARAKSQANLPIFEPDKIRSVQNGNLSPFTA